MYFVKNKIYRERLDKCNECPFYVESTKSCGTLVVGATVELPIPDSDQFEEIKLCGCIMPIKAKFAFFGCPARKWTALIDSEQYTTLKAFLAEVKKTKRLEGENLQYLYTIMDTLTGGRVERTTCAPCIIKWIREIEETMKQYEASTQSPE